MSSVEAIMDHIQLLISISYTDPRNAHTAIDTYSHMLDDCILGVGYLVIGYGPFLYCLAQSQVTTSTHTVVAD